MEFEDTANGLLSPVCAMQDLGVDIPPPGDLIRVPTATQRSMLVANFGRIPASYSALLLPVY